MNKTLSIGLLILLTWQIIFKICFILFWLTHSSLYLQECINKNKPNLHCNGKCALNKTINSTSSNQQESTIPISLLKLISGDLFFISAIDSTKTQFTQHLTKKYFALKISDILIGHKVKIEHPPQSINC